MASIPPLLFLSLRYTNFTTFLSDLPSPHNALTIFCICSRMIKAGYRGLDCTTIHTSSSYSSPFHSIHNFHRCTTNVDLLACFLTRQTAELGAIKWVSFEAIFAASHVFTSNTRSVLSNFSATNRATFSLLPNLLSHKYPRSHLIKFRFFFSLCTYRHTQFYPPHRNHSSTPLISSFIFFLFLSQTILTFNHRASRRTAAHCRSSSNNVSYHAQDVTH